MTATVLQHLLKYPHPAVFDKGAHAEPVLRVRRQAGLTTWQVTDEQLTISSGNLSFTYDLSTLTVGTLSAALQQDGFEVSDFNPDFAGLSATVLVEGRGGEDVSSGDRLAGFTNPLWSLYAAYAREVRAAGHQVQQALRQMVITQAEGEWLDLWGTLYNTPRNPDEEDQGYAPRIPQEAFRIRVNALAIEQAILDATGKDVRIEEPWGSMFRLDESALSGSQKFYDGEHVGYHLIRPVSKVSVDWADVLPVIERNRAAGVIVLDPETRLSSGVDGRLDGTVWLGIRSDFGVLVQIWVDNRLDYMVLSGEEITRNWDVMISNVITMANNDPLLDPISIAFRRNVAMASIALSEGPPIGNENFVFPRAELTQDGGEMVVSDNLELSSPDQAPVYKPVDRITLETNPRGELTMPAAEGITPALPTHIRGAFVAAEVDGTVLTGMQVSLFFTDQMPQAERVFSTASDISGLTWGGAENWGEFPWNITSRDIDLRIEACERLYDYVHNQLPIDLSPGRDLTAEFEGQITAADALNTYVEQRLSEDLN